MARVLRNFGTALATLPLRLKMPKDREAWEQAAQIGTRELVFVTVPKANKASAKLYPWSLRSKLIFFALRRLTVDYIVNN